MNITEELSIRGSIFRHKQGCATIKFEDGQTINCDFEIVQYQTGLLLTFCTLLFDKDTEDVFHRDFRDANPITFTGLTKDGYSITLDRTIITSCNISSTITLILHAHRADFIKENELSEPLFFQARFPIANLALGHAVRIEYSDPLKNHYSIIGIELKLAKSTFYLQQNRETSDLLREMQYTKGIAVTATAFTYYDSKEELQPIESILNDLNTIITFIQGTRVDYLGYDIFDSDDKLIRMCWRIADTRPYNYLTTTLTNRLLANGWNTSLSPREWSNCVQTMLHNYRAKNADWNFKELIHAYMNGAQEGDYLELRALKVCACAEMLRAAFLKLEGYPYIVPHENFCRILPELKKRIKEDLKEFLPEIEEGLLDKMAEHVRGINYQPFGSALIDLCEMVKYQAIDSTPSKIKRASKNAIHTFVEIRNNLIHSGHFLVPTKPTVDWDTIRINQARLRQFQFVERMVAGMIASMLGWMELKPKTHMPGKPDMWKEQSSSEDK